MLMPPEAGAFRRHCDVLGGVRFKSASVDKPVVFHFLFGKILAEYQQGGEDDDKQPRHSQCDLKEQFRFEKRKPELHNQQQHPAGKQSETGINAELKHDPAPK